VWSLSAGQPPYRGDVRNVLGMHLKGILPEFDPIFPMPLALLDWLEVMMNPDPRRRFRRAADAAWALSQITHNARSPSSSTDVPYETADADTLADSGLLNLETLILTPEDTADLTDATLALPEETAPTVEELLGPDAEDGGNERQSDTIVNHPMPPFPKDWGRARRTRPHLHGAGLALFGLRASGMFGRYEERDQLWSTLHRVTQTKQPHLVLIDGTSGSGKSTLTAWFCTRVDEVGGGLWLCATHSQDGGNTDGLRAMLTRSFRTAGMDRVEAVKRIRTRLKQYNHPNMDDAKGLAQLANPLSAAPAGSGLEVHFSNTAEKHTLIERYLRTLSKQRPLILWMDELQYSSDSQALVELILQSNEPSRILVVGTVQTETVESGSVLDQRLNALVDHERAEAVSLTSLDREGQISLVRDLLGLDLSLATKVANKAGGNPQFAVQLVSDWVQRGMLVPGPDGYLLDGDADVTIPPDMLTVWKQRLDAVAKDCPIDELYAIELGATLGDTVDRTEWKDALDRAKIALPTSIIDELLRLRLIERKHQYGDWSFIHGLFRAAILNHISVHGRTVQWSSICADVVASTSHDITRTARLLVAADRTLEALHPLRLATQKELMAGDWGRAKDLGDLRAKILEGVSVDPEGIHGLDTAVTGLLLYREKDRNKHFRAATPDLIEWATRLEAWDAVAQLNLFLGSAYGLLGQIDEGRPYILKALDLAREHRLEQITYILNRLCFLSIRSGTLDQASQYARESILTAESWGDTRGVARGYTMLARTHWQSGDIDSAAFYVNEAAIRYDRIGSMRGLAEVWNTRGELARARGDLDAAEVAYREANAHYESCGSSDAVFCKLNLGSTYVNGKKFTEARAILDTIEDELMESGHVSVIMVTQLVRVNCFIHDQNWGRVEEDLDRLAPKFEEVGLFDTDIASSARLAGRACEEKGRMDLAQKAWRIVHSQMTALGRTEEAAEAAAKLKEAPDAVQE
jgi:tetratricopeptide (TPR) repeat protein